MHMVDDEDSVSDMAEKPLKPEMEEEGLEISGVESREKCHSIPESGESTPGVGEQIERTASLEDNQAMAIDGGDSGGLENHAAEAVGGSELTAVQSEDSPLLLKVEGEILPVLEAFDTGNPPLSSDLQDDARVDEILEPQIEIKAEEEVREEIEPLDNLEVGLGDLQPEVKMNAEIITEVNQYAGNSTVQENVNELSDGMKHCDDSVQIELLNSSKLDNSLNVAENLEDTIVKEEAQTGDDETKLADSEEDDTMETLKTADENEIRDGDGTMGTAESASDMDEPTQETDDSPAAMQDEEDEAVVAEEIRTEDTEMETETDIVGSSGKSSGGKRKRGKWSKGQSTRASSRKTVGEDVCFICFDGGELVLCDRRGCPKAYHPSCVNRDEAFFKSKGRWNCGWHLCSICEKNARYMCFTCTYSLCKSCTKNGVILCVRGNKGFCETCMRTVTLIESSERGNIDTQIDFDDKRNWEYLFKDYYVELKNKLSLSAAEIAEAKNPWKGAESNKQELSEAQADADDGGSGSDDSTENLKPVKPKRKRVSKQRKPLSEEYELGVASGGKATALSEKSDWASKELLEFVSHMKDGHTSILSQFDVQALLLEYIKRNKLRDPRRKSQIICDARLENIFGKPRVGHFEMLKLLESHFLTRDEQNDDVQGSVVNTENSLLDNDGNAESFTKGMKDRKRKSRKKSDRGPQSNLDDYASIDMHNIGLIYMRRKLMEDLLEDSESFHDKVIGTFVRIRISGCNQKQDLYRLVQVVGISKTEEPYKIGRKSTDIMVEILNLDKTEIVSVDAISNQDFSEEECKRLRQSIKCGLISRLTVGEILDKTMELQTVRVNYWLESETQRLSHLRDRASDLGRRKQLRECVEKLQLLKTPEERRRRLEEYPEIHSDPKMDPTYESENDDSETEDNRQDAFTMSRDSGFSRRGRVPIAPVSDSPVKDSWSGTGKVSGKTWEQSKSLPSGHFSTHATHIGEMDKENSWSSERDKETHESNNLEKLNYSSISSAERALHMARSESFSGAASATTTTPLSTSIGETAVKINESEKMWHYKDPSGKIQGPFSMVQLRKWNKTGYFPADLKIWKTTDKQENAIILADTLAGKFPKELPPAKDSTLDQDRERLNPNQKTGAVSNLSSENWHGSDFVNPPSPTPKQSKVIRSGADGSLLTGAIQSPDVNGVTAAAVLPNIGSHSSAVIAASVLNSVIQTTPFSPMLNSHQVIQVDSAVPQHTQSITMNEPQPVNVYTQPPPPVQPVSQNLQTDAQGWGNNNAQPLQPHGYSWGSSNVQTVDATFPNLGPPSGLQPEVWMPTQGSQPNMHPPTAPNVSWGVGPVDSNSSIGLRPENPNIAWGTMQANPNMGWANPPGNPNMNWGPAMPAPAPAPPPGNPAGWVAPPATGNNGANVQGMMPGNPNSGWVNTQGWALPPPPGQPPMAGNGWGQPSGNAVGPPPMVPGPPPQGNAGQSWVGPSGNQKLGSWGNEQNQSGNRFPGPRGPGRGRDSGFSAGNNRPWNRQSSFGGNRKASKRDMICPYNANGRCIKGEHCNYRHA